MTDNLISKLLADAALRAQEGRNQDNQDSAGINLSEPNSTGAAHERVVYSIHFLRQLEYSPLVPSREEMAPRLPDEEFYRFRAVQVRQLNHNGANSKRNGRGSNNSNMLNNPNSTSRKQKKTKQQQQQQQSRFAQEESWMIDDEPQGNSMLDFEIWRAKMTIETAKRNGETVTEEMQTNYDRLQKSKEGQSDEKKQVEDDEWAFDFGGDKEEQTQEDVQSKLFDSVDDKLSMFFGSDCSAAADSSRISTSRSSRLISLISEDDKQGNNEQQPSTSEDIQNKKKVEEEQKLSAQEEMFIQSLLNKSLEQPQAKPQAEQHNNQHQQQQQKQKNKPEHQSQQQKHQQSKQSSPLSLQSTPVGQTNTPVKQSPQSLQQQQSQPHMPNMMMPMQMNQQAGKAQQQLPQPGPMPGMFPGMPKEMAEMAAKGMPPPPPGMFPPGMFPNMMPPPPPGMFPPGFNPMLPNGQQPPNTPMHPLMTLINRNKRKSQSPSSNEHASSPNSPQVGMDEASFASSNSAGMPQPPPPGQFPFMFPPPPGMFPPPPPGMQAIPPMPGMPGIPPPQGIPPHPQRMPSNQQIPPQQQPQRWPSN